MARQQPTPPTYEEALRVGGIPLTLEEAQSQGATELPGPPAPPTIEPRGSKLGWLYPVLKTAEELAGGSPGGAAREMEPLAPYLPATGGAIGGAIGGIPGAALGGAAGAGLGEFSEYLGEQDRAAARGVEGLAPVPPPGGEGESPALNIAIGGATEGALEGLGRGLFMAGKYGLKGAAKLPKVAGRYIPESVSQRFGTESTFGNLAGKLERYLGSSWLGRPLRAVRAEQMRISREILADLSKVPDASPRVLAENWDAAREALRMAARPGYNEVSTVPMGNTAEIAVQLLEEFDDVLNASSKKALKALTGGTGGVDDVVARHLGFHNGAQALEQMGDVTFNSVKEELLRQGAVLPEAAVTGEQALAARHALGDLASTLRQTDPSRARDVWKAWAQLDGAIDSSLDGATRAVKQEADRLWHRSYIMNDMFDTLYKMQRAQPSGAPPVLDINAFTKFVNDLAYEPAKGAGRAASRLDAMYHNPADRAALTDLAAFLKEKTASTAGASGLGESIANIGTALAAISVPTGLAIGNVPAAAAGAGYLGTLYGLSQLLSKGDEIYALNQYLREPTAAGVAALVRLIYHGATTDPEAYIAAPLPPPGVFADQASPQ